MIRSIYMHKTIGHKTAIWQADGMPIVGRHQRAYGNIVWVRVQAGVYPTLPQVNIFLTNRYDHQHSHSTVDLLQGSGPVVLSFLLCACRSVPLPEVLPAVSLEPCHPIRSRHCMFRFCRLLCTHNSASTMCSLHDPLVLKLDAPSHPGAAAGAAAGGARILARHRPLRLRAAQGPGRRLCAGVLLQFRRPGRTAALACLAGWSNCVDVPDVSVLLAVEF